MSLEAVFAVLRDGGALGLATVLVLVVGYLYRRTEERIEALLDTIETLRKEHAAEVARLNEKRIEDVRSALGALGDFSAGRAAIVDAIERCSDAIETHSGAIAEMRGSHSKAVYELRDKIVEIYHRVVGRS